MEELIYYVNFFIEICAADVATDHDFRSAGHFGQEFQVLEDCISVLCA